MTSGAAIETRRSGAWLARHALEQLPVSLTFGIPGVHNTELYDELNNSKTIHPVLVTHECGAAFMGDAVSRTSEGIGVLVIVPAAGVTHAMSGIAEAYLDGIPLLVISGGIRTDTEFGYQLHEIDQQRLLAGVTKAMWKVASQEEIVPTIFRAYHEALSGKPGPVLVEIPVNIQLFQEKVKTVPEFQPFEIPSSVDRSSIERAAQILVEAESPGIFVGWGAVDVTDDIAAIADLLGAPVSTTLQGMSAFPASHPLHTGMGFGRASVPAAEKAFEHCDALLAVGTAFGEIPTGSYGCVVPESLVHIDIDPASIGRNYPAKVAILADARAAVPVLRQKLQEMGVANQARRERLAEQIAAGKKAYQSEWFAHRGERVNPAVFFDELRRQLEDDAIVVVDDGNHTFLSAELFPVRKSRTFISPSDFNCMGYCVPAAIGAKLANPDRQVVGIVGDGAFLMTVTELFTAKREEVGVPYFVFCDGELSQISQGQKIPYNRKTCTVLGEVWLDGLATATGAHYVAIEDNSDISYGIEEALMAATTRRPVIVDVRIDYSKQTRFTRGIVKSALSTFSTIDKFRFISRALVRRVTG
jgi:acetolactate synthase-1/2/3 large subunit